MDVVHEHFLVLEHSSLHLEVQLVVQVTVDLRRLSVLLQEPTENAQTAHPHDLGRETSLTGSSPLSGSHVTSFGFGLVPLVHTGARVDGGRLAQHETVLNQLADVLAW